MPRSLYLSSLSSFLQEGQIGHSSPWTFVNFSFPFALIVFNG